MDVSKELFFRSRPASRRAKMSLSDRSAQFSPFAALTGFEDTIAETGRLTQPQAELTEHAKGDIDWTLRCIRSRFPQPSAVEITYFVPDGRKEGGAYREISSLVISMDPLKKTITLDCGLVLSLEQIRCLELTR